MEHDWVFCYSVSLLSLVFPSLCDIHDIRLMNLMEEEIGYLSGVPVFHVKYLTPVTRLLSYVSILHFCLLPGHWTSRVYLGFLEFLWKHYYHICPEEIQLVWWRRFSVSLSCWWQTISICRWSSSGVSTTVWWIWATYLFLSGLSLLLYLSLVDWTRVCTLEFRVEALWLERRQQLRHFPLFVYCKIPWIYLASGPRESHGRLACYASQGNGCSIGCALSTAARFEYAGSGFIPTSGRTAMHDKV